MRIDARRLQCESHPLVGKLVTDTLSGCRGVVTGQVVEYSRETGRPVHREIYLRPEHGGREWSVDEACVTQSGSDPGAALGGEGSEQV
jgi:hypothetical protein